MQAFGSKRTYGEWRYTKCRLKKVSVDGKLNIKSRKNGRRVSLNESNI